MQTESGGSRQGGAADESGSSPPDVRVRTDGEHLWLVAGAALAYGIWAVVDFVEGDAPVWKLVLFGLMPVFAGLVVYQYLSSYVIIQGEILRWKTSLFRRESQLDLSEVTGLETSYLVAKLERAGQEPFAISLGRFKRSDADRLIQALKQKLESRR